MKSAIALLVAALLMLGYSATLPPYKDAEAFEAKYAQLGVGDSEKFYQLRSEMLTPKYKLQDYGITALFAAIFWFIATRIKVLTAPRSMGMFIAVAVAAPFVTVAALVFDLFQGDSRGEFPHWADSLGIPLMGAPVAFIIALVWSLAHLTFLAGIRRGVAPLCLAVSRKSHPWLILVSVVTVVFILGLVAEGVYWYALPCLLWLYLYSSLAAVRRLNNGI